MCKKEKLTLLDKKKGLSMGYLVIILAFLALLSGISFHFSKRIATGSGFLMAERSIPWYVNSGSILQPI